jgi:hypothetical protein
MRNKQFHAGSCYSVAAFTALRQQPEQLFSGGTAATEPLFYYFNNLSNNQYVTDKEPACNR